MPCVVVCCSISCCVSAGWYYAYCGYGKVVFVFDVGNDGILSNLRFVRVRQACVRIHVTIKFDIFIHTNRPICAPRPHQGDTSRGTKLMDKIHNYACVDCVVCCGRIQPTSVAKQKWCSNWIVRFILQSQRVACRCIESYKINKNK